LVYEDEPMLPAPNMPVGGVVEGRHDAVHGDPVANASSRVRSVDGDVPRVQPGANHELGL